MFGEQFYPTPKEVIKQMLEPFDKERHFGSANGYKKSTPCGALAEKAILEPSAGKGDILEYIHQCLDDSGYRSHRTEFYAIEKDPTLAEVVKSKGFNVIDSDFLTYEPDMFFDYIIMNPPFKDGAKHLLKAIEISYNTEIVCLLNAETILNPHTNERKQLLEIIEKKGSFEVLGDVFKDAERKTAVNVALVRLTIQNEEKGFDFDFEKEKFEDTDFDESFIKNEIARNNVIENMMIMKERASRYFKEYIEAQRKAEYFSAFFTEKARYTSFTDLDTEKGTPQKRLNNYNRKLKRIMWKQALDEMGLQKYMSHKISQNFDAFIQQQSEMAFNKENVRSVFEMLLMNRGNILEQAIIDVFEMLTANYYSENRMYVEGWKTNDRYKVNKKIIAPTYVRYGEYMNSYDLKQYGDNFNLAYSGTQKYTDIDKVLCYISGKDYNKIITIQRALDSKFNEIGKIKTGDKYDNSCISEFFIIKFHKKGTVHLVFRDNWLWQEFNMRACAQKNWLPDNERTKWEAKRKKATKKEETKVEEPLMLQQDNKELTLF